MKIDAMYGIKFIRSVKGKIIIASILACFALFMAWQTSKNAFTAVLTSFEKISVPNEKLRLVNELSHNISRLDQVQKALLLKKDAGAYGFFDETKKINRQIDSLKTLYSDNPKQVKRLAILKKLLHERDKLFAGYLNVRSGLINNKSFAAQVQLLNKMVNESARQTDSLVTSSEKNISTTTFVPQQAQPKHKGFLSKIFGGKRSENDNARANRPYKVIDSELKIKHDTIAFAMRDSLLKKFGNTLQKMEKTQRVKSRSFVRHEIMLNKASANVMSQILAILQKVQEEAVSQTILNNNIAKNVVSNGVKRISIILSLFLLVTVVLVYLILRDISRINDYRQQLETAKEEADRQALAKHRFLSNMSHELRTPLQSVIGYAEMVNQQQNPDKKDIEAIYRASNHLLQIVNEVLDYNKVISGKFTFASEVFNLQTLLDETVSAMRHEAEKKSLALQTDYDIPGNVFLKGDPFRLKQILFNLLGNAIKFTTTGGVGLKVSGKQAGKVLQYHFEVTDTGPGLSAADISRIFNEFEQAGPDTRNSGTGLGLAITKKLVEGQGGSINVKSEPGKGSTFIFVLRFAKAAQPEVAAITGLPLNKSYAHTVWIIDDDPFILELCSRILSARQVRHKCFNSHTEVLNQPTDNDVKCILMDMRMPGMDGITLCGILRERVPADTRIYAMTAQVLPDEAVSVLNHGFDGLLMKPFRETELVSLITQQPLNIGGEPGIDLKAIEKMTFGDAAQTAAILMRFSGDCMHDIGLLGTKLKENDAGGVALVLHRIAGRTAQVGAYKLAEEFRVSEMTLESDNQLTGARVKNIELLLQKLQTLALRAAGENIHQTS